ncbi:hypothetical protein V1499_02495 [Neobacillus sp. SCS-31]|uniref:hypothetical protein n=1 Tax=Neobacillus oceani TaxID=3115292 RepID=UPI0039068829
MFPQQQRAFDYGHSMNNPYEQGPTFYEGTQPLYMQDFSGNFPQQPDYSFGIQPQETLPYYYQQDSGYSYEQMDPNRQPPELERRIRQLERRVGLIERENERQSREITRLNNQVERISRRLSRVNQRLRFLENRFNIPFTPFDGEF